MRYCIIFILIALLSGCTAYIDTHVRNAEYEAFLSAIAENPSVPDSLDDIPSRAGTLLIPPDPEAIVRVLEAIDESKERVWLQTYILTHRDIIDALVRAKSRSVDVRVSLEPHVYGIAGINDDAHEMLADAGIAVRWIDGNTYTLMHAKFLIADDRYLVSSGNMSHSTFTRNRETIFMGDDPHDLATLASAFLSDESEIPLTEDNPALLFSPADARLSLLRALQNTEHSVDMAMQSLSDEEAVRVLLRLAGEGKRVRVILGGTSRVEENAETIERLQSLGIQAVGVDRPYVHAKAFAIDAQYVFIGSVNFSESGFDRNREAGMLFENSQIARRIQKIVDDELSRE